MRIGIDIKALKVKTGIAVYLKNILDVLQKIDKENEYYLFVNRKTDYKIINTNWKNIYIPSKLPGTLWLLFRLPSYIKKYKIDVFWGPEYICPIWKTNKKLKILTTIYDLTHIHFPETLPTTTFIIIKLFLQAVIKKTDLILTISNFLKNDIIRVYKKHKLKNKVVPVFCGAPNWEIPKEYSVKNRMDFLLFVGSIEPRKNLTGLIKALEIIKNNSGINIPLRIVGPKGWKNKDFYSTIQKSNVKKNIYFMGFLSEDKLKEQYLTCKALVLPSFYEGFGLPVLEALCLDCLVLTSKDTVMEEVAKGAALYFDCKKPADIAKKIQMIYKDDFSRIDYLENKTDILNKYSWYKTATEMKKIFVKLEKKV